MSAYRHRLRDHDWTLLGLALAISAIGILQIYSATRGTSWEDAWWKQLLWVLIGCVIYFGMQAVDYRTLVDRVWPFLYLGSLAMLVAVFLFGKTVFGSRRWIPLPGFNLQVSEIVKLVLILVMVRFLAYLRTEKLEFRDFFKLLVLFAVPAGLVMKQPDLGTALTYFPILGAGLFLSKMDWRYYVALGALVLVILPVGWKHLKPYQKARVEAFLDPNRDPRGSGYQVIQSKIAVGSGGMWGKGVSQGSQTQLRFLPVPHTDFIVAAYAEEHGFIGVLVLLGLYFLLLMQLVQNAQMAPDRAGMYFIMGVTALLLFHVVVNVGMVVGRMIVTGVPLPLMSYGGSNTLSTFLMLGLVNNIRLQRFVN